ncbi:hypothetical protein [Flavobacterium cerinum]|uniref:Uncharacterized protein n=1 Tax=Flavobacterium cerinum TaxID=2502784 RepID=A0A444HAS8_9FLAO|nr:hypothetical protein [Flavobacterium cerinum]RWX00419.1 hypothetical protein EPI11_09070 [Flavobacterium cerinum]
MKKLIIIAICCPYLLGCEQISKSIHETFEPNDTLVNKQTEKPNITVTKSDTISESHTTFTSIEIKIPTITHTQTTNTEPVKTNKKDFLTNLKALTNAEDALKKLSQYAGKEIFIYSTIHFYNDGSIHTMLQHPENPNYVDKYIYNNGNWSKPEPVTLSLRDNVQSKLVSLNRINFINVAKVTETYNQKVKEVEGAKPSTNTYISIWDNQIRWLPSGINGSRERYSIQFNDDGSLKSYRQE